MFSIQQRFYLPTKVASLEQFWALVRAPHTAKLVAEARAALAKGDKATYDKKKKQLPLIIFVGTFDESEKVVANKKTGEKRTLKGRWRNQANVNLNGLVVADYDHLDGDVREIWNDVYAKLSDEDKARILLVFVTPSGQGLKVVFTADVKVGNLIDNQLDFSAKFGLKLDESCKDASRGAFLTTEQDIISISDELFTYENEEFAEQFNESYRAGKSGQTANKKAPSTVSTPPHAGGGQEGGLLWHGYDVQQIIDARYAEKLPCAADSNRHKESLKLASDLLIMLDGDKKAVQRMVEAQKWVQEIIDERNEDVERTVNSAAERMAEKEKKYEWQQPSAEMRTAIAEVTGKTFKEIVKTSPNPPTGGAPNSSDSGIAQGGESSPLGGDKRGVLYFSLSQGQRSGGYNLQMFSDLLQGALRVDMMDGVKQGVKDYLAELAATTPSMPAFVPDLVGGIMDEKMPQFVAPSTEQVVYKPEYSWNYELGTHLTLFDNTLQVDAATFLMLTKDQQIARFADSGLGRKMVNAGKSRSYGVETSLRWTPDHHLAISGNYGFTHATFTDYDGGAGEDYTGNYIPFVPMHTANLDAAYRFLPNSSWALTIGANCTGVGRIYWTEQNNHSQPFYMVTGARLTFETSRLSVMLWGKNLTGTSFRTFYFESAGRGFEQHGKPFQMGIDIKYNL